MRYLFKADCSLQLQTFLRYNCNAIDYVIRNKTQIARFRVKYIMMEIECKIMKFDVPEMHTGATLSKLHALHSKWIAVWKQLLVEATELEKRSEIKD